ncbi:hypothetical protein M1373_01025 [Candidatus Marsarchaeota archaeon]|nr:hypothetical protein [Candidatus Marsarchaeota archaeon]MCL5404250.1 hypothetical protein [Candidatus Marsarchaeota archaeon]
MEKNIRTDDSISSEILPHINSLRRGSSSISTDDARVAEKTKAANRAWQEKEKHVNDLKNSGEKNEADRVDVLSDLIASLL